MLTRTESSTYIDDMSSEVALAEAASGPDPAAGLRAARALRELAERLEALQVENARSRGWSWQEIAVFLGVSKQAVHKKYASTTAARPGQALGRRLAGRKHTGADDA
jgi:DNA-directed RNA polymerase specialized sigma24 family protein